MAVDLTKEPMITAGALARPFDVGVGTIFNVATKLGIKPTVFPNRRAYLSWEQCQKISAELTRRMARR